MSLAMLTASIFYLVNAMHALRLPLKYNPVPASIISIIQSFPIPVSRTRGPAGADPFHFAEVSYF